MVLWCSRGLNNQKRVLGYMLREWKINRKENGQRRRTDRGFERCLGFRDRCILAGCLLKKWTRGQETENEHIIGARNRGWGCRFPGVNQGFNSLIEGSGFTKSGRASSHPWDLLTHVSTVYPRLHAHTPKTLYSQTLNP